MRGVYQGFIIEVISHLYGIISSSAVSGFNGFPPFTFFFPLNVAAADLCYLALFHPVVLYCVIQVSLFSKVDGVCF